MAFIIGEDVGPYRIVEQLGQGGMATVFRAYHPGLDRDVAIKALHPYFLEESNFLARFQREARLIAKLEHPNIVPIYDFSEHDGRPYLVMKFIDGETLKSRLSKGRLSTPEKCELVDAIGSALSYAHQHGILHRDIKPSNILLASDGRIYLADFGLARIVSASESTISADTLLGTPHYISPEQAMGQSDLDERTDQYSFGVVLYELFVGQLPFTADTPYSIIHDHIYTPLPSPRGKNPDLSQEMDAFLKKSLAKNRDDRFNSISDMLVNFYSAVDAGGKTTIPSQSEKDTLVGVLHLPEMDKTSEFPVTDTRKHSTEPIMKSTSDKKKTQSRTMASRKVNKSWSWVVISLLICGIFICTIGGLWIINRGRTGKVAALETSLPTQVPSSSAPSDPQVLLEQALISFDNRQFERSFSEFDHFMELAGDDILLLEGTGKRLFEEQTWPFAAIVYLRLARIMPPPIPPDIQFRLHESVFKSSKMTQVSEYVTHELVSQVDPAIADVAKARNFLYRKEPLRAQTVLRELFMNHPNYPEGQLVQAEVYIQSRLPGEPRVILDNLLAVTNLPPWIYEEARTILSTIEK